MKCMRIILHSILLLATFPAGGTQEATSLADKTSVDLKVLETTKVSSGDPIPLDVYVSNAGSTPLLIGNLILQGSGGMPVSRIEFQLMDAKGRVLRPAVDMINDTLSAKSEPNPASAFLSSYLLLRPGYSLTTRFLLDTNLFRELSTPGYYSVSATYISNGLSYPPIYRNVGLSDDDVKSLAFKAWSGKLVSNQVRFRVVASHTGH